MIRKAFDLIKRFFKREDGPTAIEYAVMLGAIVIFCLAVLLNLGQVQNTIWQDIGQAISDAIDK